MSAFISRRPSSRHSSAGGRGLIVDPVAAAPLASPRASRKASFEGDGDVRAAAVKKSVSAKIKAASYKCGGRTPRERLSKLFGKFVRKAAGTVGATGVTREPVSALFGVGETHGFTYPQMSAVLRGVCKLKDREFDLLWHMLDTDENGIV